MDQRLFSGDEMSDFPPRDLADLVRKAFAALPRAEVHAQARKLHPSLQQRIFSKPEFAREVLRVSARQEKSFREATSLSDFFAKVETTAKFRDRTHGRGRGRGTTDEPLPDTVGRYVITINDHPPRQSQPSRKYITVRDVHVCEEDVVEASTDREKLERLCDRISNLGTETIKMCPTSELVRMMTSMIRSLIKMGVR